MAMNELETFFNERYREVDAYLGLLQNLEDATREGTPRFKRTNAAITTEQTRILSSSLYLQLYNLVEATVARCLDSVADALANSGYRPSDLSQELRAEWVRSTAGTHKDLGPKKRLEAALGLCEMLMEQQPITKFEIERGGGGNWDDVAIEELCKRVGCGLTISQTVRTSVKRHLRDGQGAMKLVKTRRNDLAHGSLSFAECSDGVTITELKGLAKAVVDFLRETIQCFVNFIETEILMDTMQEKRSERSVL